MYQTTLTYRNHTLSIFLHGHNEYISNWIRQSGTFFEVGWLDILYQQQGLLHPSTSIALDIGANIGNHTIFFEKILGFQKVYAFEPIIENFEILTRNAPKSRCIRAACSDQSGKVLMVGEEDFMGNCRVIKEKDLSQYNSWKYANSLPYRTVKSVCLDDLYLDHVSLIKIDVEGHEELAIGGAMDTISRCLPLIWIESTDQSLIKSLAEQMKYDIVLHDQSINYMLCPRSETSSKVIYL